MRDHHQVSCLNLLSLQIQKRNLDVSLTAYEYAFCLVNEYVFQSIIHRHKSERETIKRKWSSLYSSYLDKRSITKKKKIQENKFSICDSYFHMVNGHDQWMATLTSALARLIFQTTKERH